MLELYHRQYRKLQQGRQGRPSPLNQRNQPMAAPVAPNQTELHRLTNPSQRRTKKKKRKMTTMIYWMPYRLSSTPSHLPWMTTPQPQRQQRLSPPQHHTVMIFGISTTNVAKTTVTSKAIHSPSRQVACAIRSGMTMALPGHRLCMTAS